MFVEDKPVITNTPTKTGVGAGKILGVGRFLPKFPQTFSKKNNKNDLEKSIWISLWAPLF